MSPDIDGSLMSTMMVYQKLSLLDSSLSPSFSVDAWTVCFSPDSRFLASGSHLGKINLFGVESGKKESELDTRGKFTLSIAYVIIFIYNP